MNYPTDLNDEQSTVLEPLLQRADGPRRPPEYDWYERWGVRRFGFHGLSHAYCAERGCAASSTACADQDHHLSLGQRLLAVRRRRRTRGGYHHGLHATRLRGDGSRWGAVDPGLVLHLIETGRFDAPALRAALSQEAGLKGLLGISTDRREVSAARVAGDQRATLARGLRRAHREGIGALCATLGGLDALTCADGVGEHCPALRAAICAGLAWFGISLDTTANAHAQPDCDIARAGHVHARGTDGGA